MNMNGRLHLKCFAPLGGKTASVAGSEFSASITICALCTMSLILTPVDSEKSRQFIFPTNTFCTPVRFNSLNNFKYKLQPNSMKRNFLDVPV